MQSREWSWHVFVDQRICGCALTHKDSTQCQSHFQESVRAKTLKHVLQDEDQDSCDREYA